MGYVAGLSVTGPADSKGADSRVVDSVLTGTPALLIHGFMSDARSDWAGWAEALAAVGRPVYLVDLPGHGSSPTPPSVEEARTGRIVDALAEVISGRIAADTGADRVDVIGYSLGARLAWELPARSAVQIEHLVLGGISPSEPFALIDFEQLHAFVESGVAPTDPFTAMMAGAIGRPGVNTAAVARCAEGLALEPFVPTAATAPPGPVLFAAGIDDQMSAGIDALIALVPDSRLVSVPGDHLGALASSEFRTAVIAFLEE